MDKLTMAHDWAMRCNRTDLTMKGFVDLAWSYADAMQAEADKRNYSEKQDSSEWQPDFVPTEILKHDAWLKSWQKENIKPSLEWQPDWSQAPEWAKWWAMDGFSKQGNWYNSMPYIDEDPEIEDEWNTKEAYLKAPSFDYTGNWQDSLRKRPQ